MGAIMASVFGTKAHCFRRYQRMMYWMPKFKHANPYPVPRKLPSEPWELAVLALKRMAVDLENKVTVEQVSCLWLSCIFLSPGVADTPELSQYLFAHLIH